VGVRHVSKRLDGRRAHVWHSGSNRTSHIFSGLIARVRLCPFEVNLVLRPVSTIDLAPFASTPRRSAQPRSASVAPRTSSIRKSAEQLTVDRTTFAVSPQLPWAHCGLDGIAVKTGCCAASSRGIHKRSLCSRLRARGAAQTSIRVLAEGRRSRRASAGWACV
jgi:hypothetical protein